MNKKNILVGISGGIAAYKSLTLIRLFVKSGYNVKVVATPNALQFVTPLSIETLSQNKLYVDVFESVNERSTQHISLSQWADIFVVAPATANIIGKFAGGIADDALSTVFLSCKKEIWICPAMNSEMYSHWSVQKNLQVLKENGVCILEPKAGELACGDEGVGRMPEPEYIFSAIMQKKCFFQNKKVLVTAGPTYEPIDPVRFIGNRSSGLMGYCIAEAFAERGAEVFLISGPTHLRVNHPSIHIVDVQTAAQMYDQTIQMASSMDILICAAAVSDYTPDEVSNQKIKKKTDVLSLNLSPTKDILKKLGEEKQGAQILVGFALETQNEIENAQTKLKSKNADIVVLNSLNDAGAGFNVPTNKVTFLLKNGTIQPLSLCSKQEVAKQLADLIETQSQHR